MDNGNTQNFDLDRFNLDTTSEDWGRNTPNTAGNNQASSAGEHNQRVIGNIAIATPDDNSDLSSHSQIEANLEIAQTTPVTLPPEQDKTPDSEVTHQPNSDSQLSHIVEKAQKDEKLNSQDVKDIQDATREFEIADLYETIRPDSKESK